ncbi:MAG: hypothetical protein J6R38_00155 [Alistipes sp.]|nr:hypothetical protein [Alistipes sp.]MBO5877931.1 hypothetical protein [Alistipes sp.]
MKKLFLLLTLCAICTTSVYPKNVMIDSQQNYVTQACAYCSGTGVIFMGYNYYGQPVYQACANCGGKGYVVISTSSNVSFQGSNSDGYIYDGYIVLKRVASDKRDKFYKYRKMGSIYASPDGKNFYKYSGERTLTIGSIKYEGGSY